MSILHLVLALVAAQRVAELAFAGANTRRLRAEGGVELDAALYPCFIVLHAAWLASLALRAPAVQPSWLLLGLYAGLQPVRLWAIAALGRRWTTRLIVRPGMPLVRRGPYRFFRHPNYAVVAAEIAILPLAFGAPIIALVFTAANTALLARRIRVEDRALRQCPTNKPTRPTSPTREAGQGDASSLEDDMRKAIVVTCGLSLALLCGTADAADHLFTGVGAGGLTTSSQPFLNGTNNPGRSGLTVPGQGSPLSGEDRTTPTVETGQLLTHHFTRPNLNANPGNGMLRMPPPVASGVTVPMGHGRR